MTPVPGGFARLARPGRRVGRLSLRRPSGLVDQARWLFLVCAVLSLLLRVPAPLSVHRDGMLLVALAGTVALLASWLCRYVTGRAPLALDVVDAVALLAFALACPSPTVIFTVAFPAAWLRALYGSTRGVYVAWALTSASAVAAVSLWDLVPDAPPPTSLVAVAASVPVLLMSVVVARHLALGLFAREEAQHRDAAMVTLGQRLLGNPDRSEMLDIGWATVTEICRVTTGLRILLVEPVEDALLVVRQAGDLDGELSVLPLAALPAVPPPGQVRPVTDESSFVQVAPGTAGTWVCLAAPEGRPGWLVLGGSGARSPEVTGTVQALTNQVALALRTVATHRDLTTRATTDVLTGLANRARFTAALDALDETATPALLFIDLDDFKTVNDGLGHAAGDDLLRHVADRLRRAVRPQDLCARLGGDEFAVLVADPAPGVAEDIARRLVDLIATPLELFGTAAQVGASVGLAHAAPGVSPEQLVQQADVAMYAAKAAGKNRVQVFDPTLLQVDGAAVLERDLQHPDLAAQLVVHYQPIISLADGRCAAAEALVRWQHPTRGLLPPDDFLAAAKRTGVAVAIGAAVLPTACAAAAGWDVVGPGVRLHVNVSALELLDGAFLALVRRCLQDNPALAGRLVLEVTEAATVHTPESLGTLAELRALGVQLAVAEFGTGSSALGTLHTLRPDVVKIDRSLVAGLPGRPADVAVVEAVVQMAGRLGLQTVAEGVERLDQQDFLRRGGVDCAQGFLHLRPAPGADFTRWLQAQAGAPPGARGLIPLQPAPG